MPISKLIHIITNLKLMKIYLFHKNNNMITLALIISQKFKKLLKMINPKNFL